MRGPNHYVLQKKKPDRKRMKCVSIFRNTRYCALLRHSMFDLSLIAAGSLWRAPSVSLSLSLSVVLFVWSPTSVPVPHAGSNHFPAGKISSIYFRLVSECWCASGHTLIRLSRFSSESGCFSRWRDCAPSQRGRIVRNQGGKD